MSDRDFVLTVNYGFRFGQWYIESSTERARANVRPQDVLALAQATGDGHPDLIREVIRREAATAEASVAATREAAVNAHERAILAAQEAAAARQLVQDLAPPEPDAEPGAE